MENISYTDLCQILGHLYISSQKTFKEFEAEKNNLLNSFKQELDNKSSVISRLQKEIEELKKPKE